MGAAKCRSGGRAGADKVGMSQFTQGWAMAEQTNTFLTRIGSWFRRSQIGDEQPMNNEDGRPPVLSGPVGGGPNEPRSTFLRPWANRDAAIDPLQNGVGALPDLRD